MVRGGINDTLSERGTCMHSPEKIYGSYFGIHENRSSFNARFIWTCMTGKAIALGRFCYLYEDDPRVVFNQLKVTVIDFVSSLNRRIQHFRHFLLAGPFHSHSSSWIHNDAKTKKASQSLRSHFSPHYAWLTTPLKWRRRLPHSIFIHYWTTTHQPHFSRKHSKGMVKTLEPGATHRKEKDPICSW